MKKYYLLLSITFLFSLATLAQNGNIKGVIADENVIAVPGAAILIEELKKGAVSDFNGNFTIVDIPSGTYHLLIRYLGYTDFKQETVVSSSETISINVTLRSKDTELDEVEITRYSLGGQARALNIQKNKQNITNIVSTDQIGKFPDANIGDAVKRIPGITMQVDQGEARNIFSMIWAN